MQHAQHTQQTGALSIDLARLRIPPEAECVPALSTDQIQALVASVRERGIEVPLRVCLVARGGAENAEETYLVLSGRHRLGAAQVVGLKSVPCVVVDRPADIRLAMVEEAVVCRDLPRAGRAALLLDVRPELALRNGCHRTANGHQNLKKGPFLPTGQRLPTRDGHPIPDDGTVTAIAVRYGLHKTYLQAVIEARLECRPDTDDWPLLRAALCAEPMAPSRVLSCLRGIQSQGAAAATRLPGRAGADYARLASASPTSLGNAWEHWAEVPPALRETCLCRWEAAASKMPPDAVQRLASAAVHWSEHVRRDLIKRLKAIQE
jgi:hypothetical protein